MISKAYKNNTNASYGVNEVSNVIGIEVAYLACLQGMLIIVLSAVTIGILYKCRKLTTQIRLMAIHMTTTNLVYGLVIFSASVYRIVAGTLCSTLMELLPLTFIIYNIFLTASGLDRLLSLIYSIKYTLWTRKRNMHALTVCLYIAGICINMPNLPSNFACRKFHDTHTRLGLLIVVSCMIFLIICDVVIYFYIGVIAIKAKTKGPIGQTNDYGRFWSSTLKTFGLSTITVLLLTPYIVSRMTDMLYFEHGNSNISQTSIGTIFFVFTHQVVSPIFFLATYKECRYHLAMLCCCCCKDRRKTILSQYKQHYATYTI